MTAGSKPVTASEKITANVSGEDKTVKAGAAEEKRAMEGNILEAFDQLMDALVENLFARDGESLEEAKIRLIAEEEEYQKRVCME